MKNSNLLLLILSVCLLPWNSPAAEVYKTFLANRFDMHLDTRYFKTDSNYDSDGNKQSLAPNSVDFSSSSSSSFQVLNFQTLVRYTFLNDMGFYSGLNFSNVESQNSLNTKTNSSLNYFIFGVDHQLVKQGALSLYTDASYWVANEKINTNADDAITSDGASELKILLMGVAEQSSFKNFVKLGYSYRAEGLSSLLVYGAGAEFLVKNMGVGAQVDGISSVTDDQQINSSDVRDFVTDRVNAGSRKYYSVNPNSLDVELYFSYNFDSSMKLKLSGGSTVMGANSASGYFAGLSLNWGFGMTKVQSHPLNEGPKFKINTEDGVDQDLFKSPDSIKPSSQALPKLTPSIKSAPRPKSKTR